MGKKKKVRKSVYNGIESWLVLFAFGVAFGVFLGYLLYNKVAVLGMLALGFLGYRYLVMSISSMQSI